MNARQPIPDALFREVHDLADGVLDGALSDEQCARLDQLVCTDAVARQLYVRYIFDSDSLRNWAGSVLSGAFAGDQTLVLDDLDKDAICREISNQSRFPTNSLGSHVLRNAIHGTLGYFAEGMPLAYLLATVIVGVGLLIGSRIYVSGPTHVAGQFTLPSGEKGTGPLCQNGPEGARHKADLSPCSPSVGRITGMVDCQWESSENPKSKIQNPKSLVALGDKFALSSGLLEITYDTGAKVILQGPVTYEVESAAGGYLSVGKLTARLEKGSEVRVQESEASNHKSEILNHKFVVRTPTATVTDLGTEFGVEVDKQGATTSRVYRGLVQVNALTDGGEPENAGQLLRENESARVDRRSQRPIVVVPASKSPDFVREIPKPTTKTFDLVDVVAGGDGFSGKRNAGIDPTNGRRSEEVFIRKLHTGESPLFRVTGEDVWAIGDGMFHRAEELPFVDGVFIPDGSKGPIAVDSAGHTFADCPTTLNFAPYLVWAGGAIPQPGVSTTMNGVDYARGGHGLLYMHANLGITFDLNAIRKANPGWTVRRFLATMANLESASQAGVSVSADCWILVDGRVRSRRWQINAYSGATPISVLINPSDRYLTLVSTDSNKDINRDLITFGDPRLELVEEKDRQTSTKSTTKGGQ